MNETMLLIYWAFSIKTLIVESDVCPCCLSMQEKIDWINSYPAYYEFETNVKYWNVRKLISQYKNGGIYCSN